MARRYFVSGRVQGVGFRYWTVGRAKQLGLVGWVRNRRDGRVEVLAYGETGSLDSLEKELQSGPAGAQVTAVDAAPVNPDEAALAAEATRFDQTPTL
ncbi:MAG TPA: acylphosphatase [Ferrovibrio sp.]|jgi:acylphosphatase|uniref:acylphosphatase n=1 Tax=Ferrovibrio sp. TaxID=1917215 RepID=UPI002B4AD57F|nr:acylphosphatase [Ferrovibrio sp.]HLT78294.1 acylphosphatase [Ferrovibrio sp.]